VDNRNFGSLLREARTGRGLSVADVSVRTKVSPAALELIEGEQLDDLPPEVFVRGFIRLYAKAVGVAEAQPLSLFDSALAARRQAQEAAAAIPTVAPREAWAAGEDQNLSVGQGYGLAVFVVFALLLATITLSMFLRQPSQAGEGLSFDDSARRAGARFHPLSDLARQYPLDS
jgi:cytoskeletal protein RodZ